MKLMWDHTGSRWALYTMIGVLSRREMDKDMQIQREDSHGGREKTGLMGQEGMQKVLRN